MPPQSLRWMLTNGDSDSFTKMMNRPSGKATDRVMVEFPHVSVTAATEQRAKQPRSSDQRYTKQLTNTVWMEPTIKAVVRMIRNGRKRTEGTAEAMRMQSVSVPTRAAIHDVDVSAVVCSG